MIDVRTQISSVTRTLGDRVLEAGEARIMTISQVYDTDQDDLWTVVTSADRIARWFLPIQGDLVEGGRYQLTGNAGGTVTRCDKPNGYEATWEFGGQVSWIEVTLTPEGDGRTRFTLEHLSHVDEEFWEQFGPGATGIGWDSGFLGLANYLADRSAPRDPDAIMAWLGSEDGHLFLRLSSEGWERADLENGEDPVVARRRADRAFKAYTGN